MSGQTKAESQTYKLLNDVGKDQKRLDLQHETLKLHLGDVVIPGARAGVDNALKPRPEGRLAILDIGTGSGAWALDMAKRYPHAEVLGIDIHQVTPEGDAPANCKFIVYDINQGVGSYANSFDVIHGRAIVAGIKGYVTLLKNIAVMLRPGGVYLGVETPWLAYDEEKKPIYARSEDEPGFHWATQIPAFAHDVLRVKNPGCFNAMERLPVWLRGMDSWSNVGDEMHYIPAGDWENNLTEEQKDVGQMMEQVARGSLYSFASVIKAAGYPSELVDSWVAQAQASNGHATRCYIGWNYVWAIKR